jgi:hypothetical protein
MVKLGSADHEVGGCLADFRTVHHETKMLRLGVLAAFFQAVCQYHMKAHAVAIQAFGDACLQLWVCSLVAHGGRLVICRGLQA